MKKLKSIFFVLLCLILLPVIVKGDDAPDQIKQNQRIAGSDFKKDEIIVKYRKEKKQSSQNSIQSKSGFTTLKTYKRSGIKRVKITGDMDVEQALDIYYSDPDVEYAEPNYIYHTSRVPNDTHITKQWALNNTGQVVNNRAGTIDADIDALEGWDITTGSADVIVAVIDTGVDYNHPDLSSNIWINQGEIAGNGIDDDGNGKIDDVRGWDFVDTDNDPMDYNDHGTHVAGIIAAVGNNGNGVSGVAWTAKIMAIRGLGTEGSGYASDLIEAIEYAGENGADIINMSWGNEEYSQALKDSIDASLAVIVCATGNDGQNTDNSPRYPSGYDSQNIISVAATDQNDNLASFSNYGRTSVDIGAPGVNIYSTVPAKLTIWSDNFDDGNMDGWTTGGKNNRWGVITSNYFSPSYSVAVSPGNYYANYTDSWIKSPVFNLTSLKGARFDFKIKGESESKFDFLYIQASSDGTSWTDCETIDGTSDGNWINYTVDLKAFENRNTVYIRFRFVSDGSYNYEGFYLDDISVSALSTSYSGTEYQFMDGTSSAAAYVSGTAALIKALNPDIISSEIKAGILNNVDPITSLSAKVSSTGRLNSFKALQDLIPCEVEFSFRVPSIVKEGDGILTDSGSISISSPIGKDLNVFIDIDDTSEIILPTSIVIPAGETSVNYDITIIDDSILDGGQTVAITFITPGCEPKNGQILVNDNESVSVTLETKETVFEGEGVLLGQGVVTIGSIAQNDIIILLSSANPDKVTVPASVTILAGQSSAVFDITVINDSHNDGLQFVSITASATVSNQASDIIWIIDDDKASWINETYSKSLTCILRDDLRDRIYLGDPGNGHLVVLDSQSLEVILRLPLDSSFFDMSISKDNNTLVIAGKTLILVDLETFMIRPLNTNLDVVSAAFDHRGNLILMTSEFNDYLYQYNPDTEKVIRSFGKGRYLMGSIQGGGLVRTDIDGEILYVAEGVIASFISFDISGEVPLFLRASSGYEIEGSFNDFALSPRYDEIYVACEMTDGIQVADSKNFNFINLLDTGDYPGGVSTDLEGSYIYGLPYRSDNNVLYQYDAFQSNLVFKYNLLSESDYSIPQKRGIAVDRSGKHAFILHGSNYPSMEFKVQVVELYTPLILSTPNSVFENGGILNGKGSILFFQAPSEDLTVSLESSDTSKVQVPASVIIPAGHTLITFDITVLDNSILDGTKSVTITANSSHYSPVRASIDVKDNETATLTLNMPDSVSEGDGHIKNQGMISVSQPVEDDVTVSLVTESTADIFLPKKVTIPSGEMAVYFDFYIFDDVAFEGTEEVTIRAVVDGWNPGQDTILIADNETPELKMITGNLVYHEGTGVLSGEGTIRISVTMPYDLKVLISSNDETELSIPSSITIPAGHTYVNFDLTIIDDVEDDGTQPVAITANADGFMNSTVDVTVIDNDNTWIDDTSSKNLGYILRDDIRDLIYLGDITNSQLVVINSKSFDVINRLPLNSKFSDMAISKDKNTMAIAGGTLYLVDLRTFVTRQLSTTLDVYSVTFNHSGDLMLLSSTDGGYIYHYDPDTEKVIKSFGTGYALTGTFYMNGILKTNSEGTILYVADRSSPVSLYKFDVTTQTPVYLGKNVGDLGGNLVDFVISTKFKEIYFGSGSVYGIQVLDSNTLKFKKLLQAEAFVGGVAIDIGGYYVYELRKSTSTRSLFQFDTSQRKLNSYYDLQLEIHNGSPKKKGVAIDRSGKKAFIIHGNDGYESDYYKVQVVDLALPPDSDNDRLWNKIEMIACTDINDADTDDDGIPDGYEDLNYDGILDPGETDPCDADTDNDGIQDGTEMGLTLNNIGPDTNRNNFQPDLDPLSQTDPLNEDTDSDGMPDGWEEINGLDPLIDDADEDSDGDRSKNIVEYLKGTDPLDATSHPMRSMPWLYLLLEGD